MSPQERVESPEPESVVEKQPEDNIDPVMQQYMAMVQQQKNKPLDKEVLIKREASVENLSLGFQTSPTKHWLYGN